MDELTIGDKIYISSKRAAKITGYAKDYVGQLCREGRVEARLVGRNWYVLETSVREHRFGVEVTAKEQETTAQVEQKPVTPIDSTWSTPSYRPEDLSLMPKLNIVPSKTPTPVSSDGGKSEQVVADMQAAWKDWFKNDGRTPENAPEVEEEDSVAYEEAPHEVTEEDVAVTISRLDDASVEEQEALKEEESEEVVLHKTYARQGEGEVAHADSSVIDLAHTEAPEGVILRERRVRKAKPAKDWGSASTVLQAFLCAIALFAIVLGVIGSGYADILLRGISGAGYDKNVIIQYLEGTRTVEK